VVADEVAVENLIAIEKEEIVRLSPGQREVPNPGHPPADILLPAMDQRYRCP
jgi:hypothetical protein